MENKKDNKAIIYKKLFIKFASYILVLSLIVSVFSINIYAEDPKDDTYLDTYAAHYFNHLISNLGNNTENSCGYVAAGMLLSFYDTYLNDNFITNDCNCVSDCTCDYDTLGEIDLSNTIHSPGIKCEDNWKELTDYTDYNAFIDANANEYFHLRLLQIGRDELELYNPPTQNQRSADSTTKPELTGWEMDIYEVGSVIQEWFNTFPNNGQQGIIKSNVTIHISSYEDDEHKNLDDPNATIRNEMIEKVEAGIPVVYFGYNEVGKTGHFMIAHDYDESSDTVYFHTGWVGNHIMNDKDAEKFVYTANTAILWFEIDDGLEHSCSNNYVYSSLPTKDPLCACEIYSGSSGHEHEYNAAINNGDYRHYFRCVCGKISNIESHNLIYPGHYSVFHSEKCEDCSYMDFVSHEYTTFSSHTETEHTLQCACGATTTEAHYAYRFGPFDNSLHTVYCKCGKEWTEPHVVSSDAYNSGNRFAPCLACGRLVTVGMTLHPTMNGLPRSANGSFILPDGVIVLVDEDIEAYFAGTLEFNYPDDNLETE